MLEDSACKTNTALTTELREHPTVCQPQLCVATFEPAFQFTRGEAGKMILRNSNTFFQSFSGNVLCVFYYPICTEEKLSWLAPVLIRAPTKL